MPIFLTKIGVTLFLRLFMLKALHYLNINKRYGLKVITYAVTCNHIHLLAVDTSKELISKSMQLISGNTGQAYNTMNSEHIIKI